MSLLEAAIVKHRASLLYVALRIVKNYEDAEDALQDALLNAHLKFDTFANHAQLSTWLHSIVINAALMKYRSTHKLLEMALERIDAATYDIYPHAGPSPEQICAGRELGAFIEASMDRLPPILGDAYARHLEGYSNKESAEKFSIREEAVKARVWRARNQVQNELREKLGG